MSTDQRASERVGELIHHAFESLLQANTDLERLQDLIGLGMDLKQLLAPHSQMTWKFMVPQEQRFRENWNKFISAVESSTGRPQQVTVETAKPGSAALLPAIIAQPTEAAAPVTQTKDLPKPQPDHPSPGPTPSASPAPTQVTAKEESEQSQRLPPSGSVENPMEIDDSDEDDMTAQGSTVTPKRKKRVPPPGGGSPGKRSKSGNNQPPGSKDPILGTTSQSQAVSVRIADSSNKLSSSEGYKWEPHKRAKIENYGKNLELLYMRLDQLGPPFNVDRSRITHDKYIITRTDIAAIYGGESVSSFPKIRKAMQAIHPYRNFLHGNFDRDPFMPPEPGWPGLFFLLDENNNHRDARGNPIVYRTFVRHADKGCVYVGQYTFTKLEGISKEEWQGLPDKTQTIWLKFFGDTLHGNRSLARIALRASLGEEPTEAQIAAKCESIKPANIRKALAEKLRNDVRRAFSRGEERIVVWGMKCVSYDYEFESDLATKWQALDHTTSEGVKRSGAKGNPGRPRGRKRLSNSTVSDDSEDDDEVLGGRARDHLSRKARREKRGLNNTGSASAAASGPEESSDEDDLYHDADVGNISDYW